MKGWLGKLWRSLPYDGHGLFAPADTEMARLRRWAASRQWRRRFWWWTRPLLRPVLRLLWCVAACRLVVNFLRQQSVPRRLAGQVLGDCLSSGATPNEAWIWRQVFSASGPHPLPGRAASLLLLQLGDLADHRLLCDKQAAAVLLTKAGLATPPLLATIPRGGTIDLRMTPWSQPGRLFIKPCHGSAGRGTLAVEGVLPGVWRIGRGPSVGLEVLRLRLEAAAQQDALLVETRLVVQPALDDLAVTGAAPVLRLTTARQPEGVPFMQSALLAIDVPGESPRAFIRGQMWVPINLMNGRMGTGHWFANPRERYSRLPWNQAPLAGRAVPDFEQAVSMVLRAMALLPGLALVNWDLILTSTGPVILEGNTGGNWILTRLAAVQGLENASLGPLLWRWAQR